MPDPEVHANHATCCVNVAPRLLAFYRDTWNDDGVAIGWQTIAWGLVFADGTALSIPAEPPVAVTLWPSLDDAAAALDAYIDTVAPGHRKTGGEA